MARQIRWYHNEEQGRSKGDYSEEMRIEGDKGADSKEGQSMSWCSPCQETLKPILENEDNSDSAPSIRYCVYHARDGEHLPSVETSEVVGHQRYGEAGPIDVPGRPDVRRQTQFIDFVLRYDLLQ